VANYEVIWLRAHSKAKGLCNAIVAKKLCFFGSSHPKMMFFIFAMRSWQI